MLTAANSSRQARAPIRSSPQARSEAPPLWITAKPISRASITRLLWWSESLGIGSVPSGPGCDKGSLPADSSP
jgi:hypothetical protein